MQRKSVDDSIEDIAEPPSSYSSVVLDKERFIRLLSEMGEEQDIESLRGRVSAVPAAIASPRGGTGVLRPRG
jgi:hypothetical protein